MSFWGWGFAFRQDRQSCPISDQLPEFPPAEPGLQEAGEGATMRRVGDGVKGWRRQPGPSQYGGVDGFGHVLEERAPGTPPAWTWHWPPLAKLALTLRTLLSCSWGPSGFLLCPHPRWGPWGFPLPAERGSEWESPAQPRKVKVKLLSHVQLCNPMDCSLPGSSIHGIFQTRNLEWVTMSFSRGSSWPRDRTRVSCIVDGRFTIWATREVQPRTVA